MMVEVLYKVLILSVHFKSRVMNCEQFVRNEQGEKFERKDLQCRKRYILSCDAI